MYNANDLDDLRDCSQSDLENMLTGIGNPMLSLNERAQIEAELDRRASANPAGQSL